ncbi:MAG: hypothetical protein V1706_01055 [Pseudomonadota bacterium]
MPYVERDQRGVIVALRQTPTEKATELKSMMDEEILAFLGKSGDADSWIQLLSMTDIGIIRILEDLIDLLVKKNIILFTELPDEAQKKIRERKRVRLHMENESFMVDDIL